MVFLFSLLVLDLSFFLHVGCPLDWFFFSYFNFLLTNLPRSFSTLHHCQRRGSLTLLFACFIILEVGMSIVNDGTFQRIVERFLWTFVIKYILNPFLGSRSNLNLTFVILHHRQLPNFGFRFERRMAWNWFHGQTVISLNRYFSVWPPFIGLNFQFVFCLNLQVIDKSLFAEEVVVWTVSLGLFSIPNGRFPTMSQMFRLFFLFFLPRFGLAFLRSFAIFEQWLDFLIIGGYFFLQFPNLIYLALIRFFQVLHTILLLNGKIRGEVIHIHPLPLSQTLMAWRKQLGIVHWWSLHLPSFTTLILHLWWLIWRVLSCTTENRYWIGWTGLAGPIMDRYSGWWGWPHGGAGVSDWPRIGGWDENISAVVSRMAVDYWVYDAGLWDFCCLSIWVAP